MSETVETVETVDATDAVETAPVKRPRTRYTTNDGVLTVQYPNMEDGFYTFPSGDLEHVKDALALHAYVSLHRRGATHETILSGVAIPDYSATAPKATRGPRVTTGKEPSDWIKAIAQVLASELMQERSDLTENQAYQKSLEVALFMSKEDKARARGNASVILAHAKIVGLPTSLKDLIASASGADEPLEYAAD